MNNLIGLKFGRLIVIEQAGKDKWSNYKWLCQCSCGKRKIIFGHCLKSETTKSCGCLQKEIVIKIKTKHNHSKKGKWSKIYIAWRGMIQRCTNPSQKYYYRYGGRGIKVCERWMKFENFLTDMGESPTNKHQLDRIDNNGNYCQRNCRWTTIKQQMRNKCDNLYITYNGKTQLLIEWSEETGISYQTLWSRIFKQKWTIKKALTVPVKKHKRKGDK